MTAKRTASSTLCHPVDHPPTTLEGRRRTYRYVARGTSPFCDENTSTPPSNQREKPTLSASDEAPPAGLLPHETEALVVPAADNEAEGGEEEGELDGGETVDLQETVTTR